MGIGGAYGIPRRYQKYVSYKASLPPVFSSLDCDEQCHADLDCVYWTFDSELGTCLLLEDCKHFDDSCAECLTGETSRALRATK